MHSKCCHWTIWADTGGTFTDVIATPPGKNPQTSRLKILSSSCIRATVQSISGTKITFQSSSPCPPVPGFWKGCSLKFFGADSHSHQSIPIEDSQETTIFIALSDKHLLESLLPNHAIELASPDAPPVFAARLLTETPHTQPLPSIQFNVATTLATNALLEKNTPPVILFINDGLQDLLTIGSQQRDHLFHLKPSHSCIQPQITIPVTTYTTPKGHTITPINPGEINIRTSSRNIPAGTQAAVCLLHSYANPEAELALKQHLERELGIEVGEVSSEVAPYIKILERAETVVVNTALTPVLSRYLGSIEGCGADVRVRIMTSAGTMSDRGAFKAKDSLLSGPAGGVIGVGWAARQCGSNHAIGLDMGGTSTDVSRYLDGPVLRFQHRVGSARISGPSVEIETVAAGGGSVCSFSRGQFHVGPESAGSSPGPACYGFGGPLTLTDVNLLAGRMDASAFGIPVVPGASEQKLAEIMKEVEEWNGTPPSRDELLLGFLEIANENMAEAIRTISVREGYHPGEFPLIAFGGAGGQHGCEIADRLEMDQVLCPLDAGILSARGLHQAIPKIIESVQLRSPLDSDLLKTLPEQLSQLEKSAISQLANQELDDSKMMIESRLAEMRITGQEQCEIIHFENIGELEANFSRQFFQVFGYHPDTARLEIVTLRVIASIPEPEIEKEVFPVDENAEPPSPTPYKFSGEVAYTHRDEVNAGHRIDGPAVIQDSQSTIWIPEHWSGTCGTAGTIRLTKCRTEQGAAVQKVAHRIVETEVYSNRFSSIAEQMGEMLKRTAVSTNVKERLDFSCAVMDRDGYLVANAPHIPVHLGALGTAVRAVIEEIPMQAGDMVITNHPAFGGSHLPDITVIMPVFTDSGTRIGFVANRAHHAEVGGMRAGSMPPNATKLSEEGVVIPPVYLFKNGESRLDDIRRILLDAPYPTRQIAENMADLTAQAAANRKGAQILLELSQSGGIDSLQRNMVAIRNQAKRDFADKLASIEGFASSAVHTLDDGHEIHLTLEVQNRRLKVDFTGTSPVHPKNLNANPGIVRSALLYCIRLWVDRPIPLNDGLLELVDLELPHCFLNPSFPDNPDQCPAVVGGNTETSQMIVEAFVKATHLMAGSQGTMNNFIFGNDQYSFYETIGGGSGAGPGFHGSHAIHSHMTNTAITDPEIIESRYPVRLKKFAVRTGSGGKGKFHGGDGIIREIQFLEPFQLNIISHQRKSGPQGLEGGQSGKPGEQAILRPNPHSPESFTTIPLKHIDQFETQPGDIIQIKTPGGGAFGGK